MNFLAHLYLSGDNRELLIGNFIADHVKGKTIHDLPSGIREGVLLHRKIDAFTDQHPVVALTKNRLRPHFRKYAPVVADVYYDHFLAAEWTRYSAIPLDRFAEQFYALAREYESVLPPRTRDMLPFMIRHNWLLSYATTDGIHNVLTGMSRRTAFESRMETGSAELIRNYVHYQNEFRLFFDDLVQFAGLHRHAPGSGGDTLRGTDDPPALDGEGK